MIPRAMSEKELKKEFRGVATLSQAYAFDSCRRLMEIMRDGEEHYHNELFRELGGSKTTTGRILFILTKKLGILEEVGYGVRDIKGSPVEKRAVRLYRMKPEYVELLKKHHDVIPQNRERT